MVSVVIVHMSAFQRALRGDPWTYSVIWGPFWGCTANKGPDIVEPLLLESIVPKNSHFEPQSGCLKWSYLSTVLTIQIGRWYVQGEHTFVRVWEYLRQECTLEQKKCPVNVHSSVQSWLRYFGTQVPTIVSPCFYVYLVCKIKQNRSSRLFITIYRRPSVKVLL